jgi:hypothetical protein
MGEGLSGISGMLLHLREYHLQTGIRTTPFICYHRARTFVNRIQAQSAEIATD